MRLLKIIFFVLLCNPVWAQTTRICEMDYICSAAAMSCTQYEKYFNTYTDFDVWLKANPGVNWWVLNSTMTTIRIIIDGTCTVGKVCRDKYGVCI